MMKFLNKWMTTTENSFYQKWRGYRDLSNDVLHDLPFHTNFLPNRPPPPLHYNTLRASHFGVFHGMGNYFLEFIVDGMLELQLVLNGYQTPCGRYT